MRQRECDREREPKRVRQGDGQRECDRERIRESETGRGSERAKYIILNI